MSRIEFDGEQGFPPATKICRHWAVAIIGAQIIDMSKNVDPMARLYRHLPHSVYEKKFLKLGEKYLELDIKKKGLMQKTHGVTDGRVHKVSEI